MSVASAKTLYELTRCGLLTHEQLATLIRTCYWGQFPTTAFVQEMLRSRGWMTGYQFEKVMHGHVDGLRVGRYLIIEKLGEGGFGKVYRARETDGMQREVTLKLMRKELTQDPQVMQRFLREMMVVGRLNHRHLVSGLDASHQGKLWYLVLEYVRGIDLKHLVARRGPLPWPEACEYARQAADGLQYILQSGLIHRDIKPANLLREDPTGTIKILDLGLAKLEEVFSGRKTDANITTGLMIGTPEFMAPEQFEDAHTLDIRADLYSLGCVLYFLLAGHPPFQGNNAVEVLQGVLEETPPDLMHLRPDIPPQIGTLVNRMMSRRQTDRPTEPIEVSRFLKSILSTVPPLDPSSDMVQL